MHFRIANERPSISAALLVSNLMRLESSWHTAFFFLFFLFFVFFSVKRSEKKKITTLALFLVLSSISSFPHSPCILLVFLVYRGALTVVISLLWYLTGCVYNYMYFILFFISFFLYCVISSHQPASYSFLHLLNG